MTIQQLAYTYGIGTILNNLTWRINRIAVLPKYQNAGFGTQILAELLKVAKLANIQMITSAFGASKKLLRFWQHNNYEVVKLGRQVNSVTGLVNAIVIQPIASQITHELMTHIQEWHTVSQEWNGLLDKDCKQEILQHDKQFHDQLHGQLYHHLYAHATNMIKKFLDGSRSLDYAEIYIYWYIQYRVKTDTLTRQSAITPSILIDRYIHGHSLETIMTHYQLANKKAVIVAIKTALQQIASLIK